MATLISNASGNFTGAATFAASEIGTGALQLVRGPTNNTTAANSLTSSTFTVTTAKVIDAVLLWVKQTTNVVPNGTFKVDLQKGGVSQASVTVNKADLPDSTNAISVPVLFKLTSTATGDGGSNWTIVITTTGSAGTVTYNYLTTLANFTRALRTTTAQTPAAGDDIYVVGELTGAGTNTPRTVTMDSTATTAYGNGALNSTTVAGGGIHVSNYGTLSYGTSASTNYVLRVNGDVMVYQFGTLNVGSTGAEIPRTSTAVLEFQQVSADGDFGLRCLDNSVVNIAGLSRTSGKNIVKCKLTADVASSNVLSAIANQGLTSNTANGLGADGLSLLAINLIESSASGNHSYGASSPSVTNTTQTATVWLARGTGANNRFVRFMVGNGGVPSSVANGFYSDIDLQAGTAGTVTALGNGTATSVTITAVGSGFLIRMTGKVSSGAATPNVLVCCCSAATTISYTGSGASTVIVDHISLVTVSSISDTTFNVDTDTGWLNGDAVCVAATTRTASECEIYPLNANAGASSFTSALYPFGINNIFGISTHHGTAPVQAEIGLLTRNVKIRSTSNTLMSYVYCTALSTVTASWAEFYYVGANVANKRGIEIEGGAVANPKSITYCALHDLDNWGLTCITAGTTSLNLVFSNNVLWLSYSQNPIILNGAITNTDWTLDNNLVMRITAGVSLNDLGGTYSNNVIVGATGTALTLSGTAGEAAGSFGGNTIHSCASGLNMQTTAGIITLNNFSCWRCNGVGLAMNSESNDIIFNNLTLFGNNTYNFQLGTNSTVTINGGLMAGDTSFPTNNAINITSGTGLSVFNVSSLDLSGVGSIYAPHAISDFVVSSAVWSPQGKFNNCKFGAPSLFSARTWTKAGYLGFEKYNQTAGDHRTEMTYGQLRTDGAVYHTAAPSMKMTPNSAGVKLESAPRDKGMLVAVNSGQTATASVYVRKDTTYTGAQPRLIVRANAAIGLNTDTVLVTDATGTVTGTTRWNPSDLQSTTLSGGDLIATSTSASGAARAMVGYSSGKYYWEFTFTNQSQVGTGAGLSPAGALATIVTAGGVTGFGAGGGVYVNSVLQPNSFGSRSNGDIIGIAVDLTAQLIWYRIAPSGNWNNSGTANPATGAGGFSISALSLPLFPTFFGATATGQVITANFGASAFSGTVPSGFTSGWSMAVPSTAWHQLTGTTAAATDAGAFEFIVDCDGTLGFINLDDWTASVATPVSYPTWDAATIANVTLSGGNLTVTNTGGSSGDQGARVAATSAKTTGKYYFEVTVVTNGGGGNTGVGIATTTSNYTAMGNNATMGVETYVGGGAMYSSGSSTGQTIGAITSGGTYGIAVDLDNRKIWFRIGASGFWNATGASGYDPVTNVGGLGIPSGSMTPICNMNASGNVFTANFGASAFVGAVPSGYTSGWSV